MSEAEQIEPSGAVDIVRAYLAAMERRELDAAAGFLAPGCVMTFPGGHRFTALADIIGWAATRYRHVTKSLEGFEQAGESVWCFGTLAGAWPDGAPFAGIRFVDRFVVREGKITDQKVWNDLAEAMHGRGLTGRESNSQTEPRLKSNTQETV